MNSSRTGVEVEELTPKRIDEILRPVADEIKQGKPTNTSSE